MSSLSNCVLKEWVLEIRCEMDATLLAVFYFKSGPMASESQFTDQRCPALIPSAGHQEWLFNPQKLVHAFYPYQLVKLRLN
jgi:hypothetical protein